MEFAQPPPNMNMPPPNLGPPANMNMPPPGMGKLNIILYLSNLCVILQAVINKIGPRFAHF